MKKPLIEEFKCTFPCEFVLGPGALTLALVWLRRRMYTENERLIEITRLIRRRLRVASGDHALEMLLWCVPHPCCLGRRGDSVFRSKSTIDGLKAQLRAPAWTIKIEMKQWLGDMPPEAEFRMFVWNGQLTAACQVRPERSARAITRAVQSACGRVRAKSSACAR